MIVMTEERAKVIIEFVELCYSMGVKRPGPSDEVVQQAKDFIKKDRKKAFSRQEG